MESKLHDVGDHGPTSIGSIYSVNNPSKSPKIKENLQNRIKKILLANTWLMARVRTLSEPKRTGLVLEEQFEDPEDYIINGEDSELTLGLTYNSYRTILSDEKFKVGNSLELVDKDGGKLTKFCVVSNPDKTTFAIVLTINHIIADGDTIHRVWKMLDENSEIVSLDPERNHTFEDQKFLETRTSFNPIGMTQFQTVDAWMSSGFLPCVMKGIKQKIQKYPQDEWILVFDDDEKKARKEIYNSGDSFVSTNDIILSWIQELTPKSDNLFIPINLRGRVEGVHSDLAGNYLAISIIKNKDLKTPATVRTWLNNVSKPGYDWSFPSYSDYRRFTGGIVTNRVGFYHHVEPAGSRQVLQFPVAPVPEYSFGGIPLGADFEVVIFKPNPGVTAAQITSRRRNLNIDVLLGSALVKGELIKMK